MLRSMSSNLLPFANHESKRIASSALLFPDALAPIKKVMGARDKVASS
jgi:hypothetical protein